MSVEVKGLIVSDFDRPVYDFYGIPATSPGDIKNEIATAGDGPLEVKITTCYGGDIDAASEIYTEERDHQAGTNIKITALAASAASVVAMGGHCEMSPTARIFVHRVSADAEGNSDVHDQASYQLKQADKALASAYMAKSGMSQVDALKMMKNETYLTAQQATDYHLVDGVMFDQQPVSGPTTLENALGGLLPRAVIEKTRKMLAEKKNPAVAQGSKKPSVEDITVKLDTTDVQIAIARAKLNLIEKTELT